jgi:hypothetical protein
MDPLETQNGRVRRGQPDRGRKRAIMPHPEPCARNLSRDCYPTYERATGYKPLSASRAGVERNSRAYTGTHGLGETPAGLELLAVRERLRGKTWKAAVEGWGRTRGSPAPNCLEVQLHRHLDDPGSGELSDGTEGPAAAKRGPVRVPVAVIHDVEEVGANFGLPALG